MPATPAAGYQRQGGEIKGWHPPTKRPISEVYLTGLGVDPSQVRAIVASHWHDDHVAGISQLRACAGRGSTAHHRGAWLVAEWEHRRPR